MWKYFKAPKCIHTTNRGPLFDLRGVANEPRAKDWLLWYPSIVLYVLTYLAWRFDQWKLEWQSWGGDPSRKACLEHDFDPTASRSLSEWSVVTLLHIMWRSSVLDILLKTLTPALRLCLPHPHLLRDTRLEWGELEEVSGLERPDIDEGFMQLPSKHPRMSLIRID